MAESGDPLREAGAPLPHVRHARCLLAPVVGFTHVLFAVPLGASPVPSLQYLGLRQGLDTGSLPREEPILAAHQAQVIQIVIVQRRRTRARGSALKLPLTSRSTPQDSIVPLPGTSSASLCL